MFWARIYGGFHYHRSLEDGGSLRLLTLLLFLVEAVEEECGEEMKTKFENDLREVPRKEDSAAHRRGLLLISVICAIAFYWANPTRRSKS